MTGKELSELREMGGLFNSSLTILETEERIKADLYKNPLKKITIDIELLKGTKRKRFSSSF